MDAVLGCRCADRPHRTSHRAAAHRYPSRDVLDAPGASRGREQDARLLPLDLEGGYARGSALPLEREDALRQDLHYISVGKKARRQASARGDLQTRGRGCMADGPRVSRGLQWVAVPLPPL